MTGRWRARNWPSGRRRPDDPVARRRGAGPGRVARRHALLIRFLRAREIGQPIREDGPQGHITKAGTPTMGGLAIVGSARSSVGCVADIVRRQRSSPAAAPSSWSRSARRRLVGLIDDGIKVFKARNLGSQQASEDHRAADRGRRSSWSLVINLTNVDGTLSFTRYDYPGIDLGTVGWALLAVLLDLRHDATR